MTRAGAIRGLAPLALALVACAPLPEGGGAARVLSPEGVRPGVGAAHDPAARPPLGTPISYLVHSPLRADPSRMEVTFAPREGGFTRIETVRLPESSAAEAGIIAAMIRQRDARAAEVDGTDIVLRAIDRTDARLRTLASDRGGPLVRWDPHDCRATPGDCRMSRTNPDGRTDHLMVTTTEAGGVWKAVTRRDPSRDAQGRTVLVEEAVYSIDADGVLIDMNRRDHERDLGGYQEIRRVE